MTSSNLIRRVGAAGDDFAVGYALGSAVGSVVRERVFITPEFRELETRWKGSARLSQLEAAARRHFPGLVREIEGMAVGAELDFQTLFLWNCRGDLRLPPNGAEAEGCTCVLLPAGGGDDDAAVIAHNEDGAPEFLGHCFWVSVSPDAGPAFKSFMYPGMLPGHTFGVNAAGLVQTINNVRVHDLQEGVPRQIITRAVLGCAELDEAIALLQRPDRASGFHHALGQAGDHRVLSVEAPASGCHVHEVSQPTGHANHLVYDTFAATAQEITDSSRLRQDRAEVMLTVGGHAPEAVLFDSEAPVYRDNDDGDDYAQTLATGVFKLYADRVEWAVHAGPSARNQLKGSIYV